MGEKFSPAIPAGNRCNNKQGSRKTFHNSKTLFSLLVLFYLLFSMALCGPQKVNAQVYPVTVVMQGDPVFCGSLSSVASGLIGNFSATLFFNDVDNQSRQIYLAFEIEGGNLPIIKGKSELPVLVRNYLGGGSLDISNEEFRTFFDIENLSNLPLYNYNQPLAEGIYCLKLSVYDQLSQQRISNTGLFFFTIRIPTLPIFLFGAAGNCGSVVNDANNLLVQWAPAFSTDLEFEYEFQWVKTEDLGAIPEMAFNDPTLMNKEQVDNTSFLFPSGELGHNFLYVYRVKAIAYNKDGQLVEGVFPNGGFSPVCWFTYQSPGGEEETLCAGFTSFRSTKVTTTTVSLAWESDKAYGAVQPLSYSVNYRPQGQPDASYCRVTNITSGNFTLSGLEPGSTLQLFVTAHCSETDSVNSPTILVSLPEVSNARCGEPPVFDPASLKNPLASLKPGDVVYIGNLTMIVDQATGTNGKFSGTGVITLVFDLLQDRIPSLAAEFTNLYIDSTYNVVGGFVKSVYDVKGWDSFANLDALTRGGKFVERWAEGLTADKNFDGPIESVKVEGIDSVSNGGVTTYSATITVNYSSPVDGQYSEKFEISNFDNTAFVIKGSDNVYYGIDLATGEVVPLGKYDPDSDKLLASFDPKIIDATDASGAVFFSGHESNKLAFDPANIAAYGASTYYTMPYRDAQYTNNNTYFIRWKLLARGETPEKVVANLPAGLSDDQKNQLIFITSHGITLTPQLTGNTATLDLAPANGDENYSVHVLLPVTGGKPKHLGRLDVVTRSHKTYNAVLVNLGGAADLQTMKDWLDQIYNRYGIDWNLTEDTGFLGDTESQDEITAALGIDYSERDALFREYKPGQQALNARYKAYATSKGNYDNKAVYLFVLPTKGTQLGDMPIGKQWGYLFGTVSAQTLAHELGHGKLLLTHTFANNVPQGSTTNLMDYATGDSLIYIQWTSLHDLAMIDPFQDDGDGALDESLYLSINELIQKIGKEVAADEFAIIHSMKCSKAGEISSQVLNIESFSTEIPYLGNKVTPKELFVIPSSGESDIVNIVIRFKYSENITDWQSQISNVSIPGVNSSPFLGVAILKDGKQYMIKCNDQIDQISIKLCETPNGLVEQLLKEDSFYPYVSSVLTAIKNCLSDEKVGDYFYNEYVSQATTDEQKDQLRQIADTYSLLSDLLFDQNNANTWVNYGDYFKAQYDAYKSLDEDFSDFFDRIKAYALDYESRKSLLAKFSDRETVTFLVRTFSDAELEFLPVELRSKCLNVLASKELRGTIRLIGTDEEQLVIRLVKNIKTEDVAGLIEELRTNDLINKIDDGLNDIINEVEDHYSDFISIMEDHILRLKGINEETRNDKIVDLFSQDKFFNIAEVTTGEYYISASKIISSGKITITLEKFVRYEYVQVPDGQGGYQLIRQTVTETQILPPMDFDEPVVLYHNAYKNGIDSKLRGTTEIVPAITLHYYLNCSINDYKKTLVYNAIDAVSLVAGVGALTTSTKLLRMAIAIADITSSLTGLISSASKEYLINNYAEGEAIYTSLQLVSAFTGFVDLGASGATRVRNLLKDDIVKLGALNKTLKGDATVVDIYNKTQKFIDDVSAVDADIVTSIKTLEGYLDNLRSKVPTAYWSKFIDDFASDISKLDIFDKDPRLIGSWATLQQAGSKFVKTDINYLKKFANLTSENQKLIAQFSDAASGSTLTKFLDDCDAVPGFLSYVNNADNLPSVKAMLMHKLPEEEIETIAEIVTDGDPMLTKVKEWVDRSASLNNFLQKMADGVFYGKRAARELLKGETLGAKLASDLGININDYSLFREVQLWVNNEKTEYMIADILLVKYDAGGVIEDIVLVENKLSMATRPTTRQLQGMERIRNGATLEVKARTQSQMLNASEEFVDDNKRAIQATTKLSIPKEKALKVSDEGSPDGNFNVSQLIPN